MPRLRAKSFAAPDDSREVPKAHFRIVKLDEVTFSHAVFEPGWRWSTDLAPTMGVSAMPIHHRGYTVSGRMRVVMDDGETIDLEPGSVYEIPPGHDAWVLGDEAWITIDTTSGRPMVGLLDEPGERVIATVLFSDIVDSTATAARDGDAAWSDRLRAHNERMRAELNLFRGREISTTGDGFLAVFDSASRAVQCAAAMVRAANGLGLPIRVGIHTGEIEFVGTDARGLAVHAAARVLAVAGTGEVLVSSTTRDLLEGSGITFEDAGMHELKGLSGARALSRLVSAEAVSRGP